VHNLSLSLGSATLLVALVLTIAPIIQARGFYEFYCDPTGLHATGFHIFLYYVNYLFKWVELLDTVLLSLRGKPLPFLHVYHHSATLILAWINLRDQTCLQWIIIGLNLVAHVIMYLYYALTSLQIKIWWKKYLTILQICQFIIGLGSILYPLTASVLSTYGIAGYYKCHGEFSTAYFGTAILASYLFLFLHLYRKTYTSKSKSTPSRAAAIKLKAV